MRLTPARIVSVPTGLFDFKVAGSLEFARFWVFEPHSYLRVYAPDVVENLSAAAILVGPLMYCADETATAPAPRRRDTRQHAGARHRNARAGPPARCRARRRAAAAHAVRASGARASSARRSPSTRFSAAIATSRARRATSPRSRPATAEASRSGRAARGSDRARRMPSGMLIPRNAPPLFNLAAMRHLFWDGRVEIGPHGTSSTPAGNQLSPQMRRVLEFGPASALGHVPRGQSRRDARVQRERARGHPRRRQSGDLGCADAPPRQDPRVSAHVRGGVSRAAVRAHDVRARVERDRRVHGRQAHLLEYAVGSVSGRTRQRAHTAAARRRADLSHAQVLALPQRRDVQRREVPRRGRGAGRARQGEWRVEPAR